MVRLTRIHDEEGAPGPLPVAIPVVRHVGHPATVHPHPWAVLGWIEGLPGGGPVSVAADVMARTPNRVLDEVAAPTRRRDRGGIRHTDPP